MTFFPGVPQVGNNLGLNPVSYTQAFQLDAAAMGTLNSVPITLVPAQPHVLLLPQWALEVYQPVYPIAAFSGLFTPTVDALGLSFQLRSIDGTAPAITLESIVTIAAASFYGPTVDMSGQINTPITLTSDGDVTDGGGTLTIYLNWLQLDLTNVPSGGQLSFSILAVYQSDQIFTIDATSGDVASIGSTVFVSGSTGNDGQYTVVAATFINDARDITALNQGAKTFTVTGNHETQFPATSSADVAGSTGNDGTYTVVSAVFGAGSTVITVVEAIPDATADGTIINSSTPDMVDLVVSEAIPDSTADGDVLIPT